MATLRSISTPVDGRIEIPPGWRQGRGAFGGLTVSILMRAVEQAVGDPERAIRSVTAEIPGATEPGPADVSVEILRHGRSVTTARATLAQAGEVRTHAVAIVGAARRLEPPLAWRDLRAPDAPPWRELAAASFHAGTWPEFGQHFEYRAVQGAPLGGGPAQCIGWIRARERDPVGDAASIAALIDAWYPAAMVRMPAMRPCATIAFTLELVDGTIGLDPDAPLLYRGTVPVCGDGYFLETRELWGEDGRLVALNHQTFAIIR